MSDVKLKTCLIRAEGFDPWRNQALEEALLHWVPNDAVVLYLWQNENTVVIGRHQNVWKEARWKQLEEAGGKLARRLSGGGAVYHDRGNLNFTFCANHRHYDVHRQMKVILGAVKKLGIDAEFSGRNDLTVDGQKFSGNAFHRTPRNAMHHGTLLLDVDFNKLSAYLNPPQEKLRSKGVESVRARVVNLAGLNPKITLQGTIDALHEALEEEYAGPGEVMEEAQFSEEIDRYYPRYADWDWRYGETPDFDIDYSTRFVWGTIEIGFTLKDAKVKQVRVYSDTLESLLIDRIEASLEGVPFKRDELFRALDDTPESDEQVQIVNDIKDWLDEKEL
ncbi:lipoate--protein ligase [bacterium]|nr:lipoate--protein ligase [bacterium]